jgi:superfamily II RNA helicase
MVKICNTPYPVDSEYNVHFEQYPYPLSDFQKYAIEAVVTGNHTLVTAHTGSGKTLPAEFAIGFFHGLGKKVIYTSPIKALSNQKYYEFSRKYPHISFGLFTGDIKTNPEADVLIMTTEILMNALFRGNHATGGNITEGTTLSSSLQFQIDIETEVGCVVFDEVHYINDVDRGQVWEKTILMMPNHIQMIMLSATIDAPERFACWCERGGESEKTVYLASTNHRVVPLTHYGFLTTTESIFKGMKDKVLEKEIRDNTNTLIPLQKDNGQGYLRIAKTLKTFEQKQTTMKRAAVLNNLVLYLRDHDMLPAIGFVFSRKHVELCAHEITIPILEDDSKVPYTVRKDCEQIVRKLPNYREYLELPEYNHLVALLEKGIGIHHSGMIPILREIVELMISKRYIKLLFATESFAIGLDCPIKTAIFTGLTKFDGSSERYLMSHEYTQMAGRAGRRGIDTIGHVVHCNNLFKLPTQSEYATMLGGKPQSLVSKFRISYSIVLNLLKKHEKPLALQNLVDFVKKSMVNEEIEKSLYESKQRVHELASIIEQKTSAFEELKTPVDDCVKYLDLEQKLKTATNKHKKQCERDIREIMDAHPKIKDYAKSVGEYRTKQNEWKKEKDHYEYLENYLQEQVRRVIFVMVNEGFVEESTDGYYTLSDSGKMASTLAEVHPLIFVKLLQQSRLLADLSPKQCIGLLSTFTDVKVPADEKYTIPVTDDRTVKQVVSTMATMFLDLESVEQRYDMRTGIQYDEYLQYDMIDAFMQWADCETEADCKYFIQQSINISVGDFTKAIMKVAAIVKELMSMCEEFEGKDGFVELYYRLSKIEPMILKYITTAQSLYV